MENRHIVECNDFCGLVVFSEMEDDAYSMTYYAPVFYTRQESFIYRIVERIKWAATVLIGRDFLLYEIILKKNDMIEMNKIIEKMIE